MSDALRDPLLASWPIFGVPKSAILRFRFLLNLAVVRFAGFELRFARLIIRRSTLFDREWIAPGAWKCAVPGMLYCVVNESPITLAKRATGSLWDRCAMPRMEDRIRKLCSELLAKKGDEEFRPIIAELRDALHQHVERLRERFGAYPMFVERRTQNDISPLIKQQQERTAKENSAADESS